MPTFTGTQLLASAKASVNQTGSSQIDQADWLIFIDEEHRALRRRMQKVAPAAFVKLMSFTVSSGTTWTIAVTDNDFADVHLIEKLVGGEYFELHRRDFRLLGNVIEFLSNYQAGSSVQAAGTYRLHYLPFVATRITATSDAVTLPDGADLVVSQMAGARAAETLDDPQLAATCRKRAEALFKDVLADLINVYGRTARGTRDVRGRWR